MSSDLIESGAEASVSKKRAWVKPEANIVIDSPNRIENGSPGPFSVMDMVTSESS